MKAKITKPSAPNIVKSIKDIKTGELYNVAGQPRDTTP